MMSLKSECWSIILISWSAYLHWPLISFFLFFFGSENARRPVTVFFDLILADFACKLYGFRMSNTTTRTSPGITLMSGVKIYSVNAADEDYQAFAFTSKLKVSRFGLPVD